MIIEVEEAVINAHNELLEELGIDLISSPEAKICRENGIDSLGIVTLILNIEEKLDIDLEESLKEIRNSSYISELIEIVENVYKDQKG